MPGGERPQEIPLKRPHPASSDGTDSVLEHHLHDSIKYSRRRLHKLDDDVPQSSDKENATSVESCSIDLRPKPHVSSQAPLMNKDLVDLHGICVRSKAYWFLTGDIILKVGNTVYQVHESILKEHSEYFSSRLITKDEIRYVSIPFQLSKSQIELLLLLMYQKETGVILEYCVDDWRSIKEAAYLLQCEKIEKAAISKIEDRLDGVNWPQVKGLTRDLSNQQLSAMYKAFWERNVPLTPQGGGLMCDEDVAKIALARKIVSQGGRWEDAENIFQLRHRQSSHPKHATYNTSFFRSSELRR